MRDGWMEVPVCEVARQVRRQHAVEPGTQYPLLGVRWYGQGPFLREVVAGGQIKATRLYKVAVGDFIYNRLFAWKGSFGLIAEEHSECYVSGEFPLFECDTQRVEPSYLNLVMCQPHVWAQIERESTGSTTTSRNRWKEERFLEWEVALPPLDEQRRIVDLIRSMDAYIDAARQSAAATRSARRAMWSELLSAVGEDWDHKELGEICYIDARLADPKQAALADLPHVGVEKIESGTGRVLALRSASEDGVVSSKFLFGPEDVLYSKIRPELRKAAFPQITGLASADIYPLRPKPGCIAEFLLILLLSDEFSEMAIAKSGRTKMPKVNREELFSIEVPVPQILEQRRIAGLDLAISAEIDAMTRVVTAADSLRSSILSGLLSGEHQIPVDYETQVGSLA